MTPLLRRTQTISNHWLNLLAWLFALVIYAFVLWLPIPAALGLFVRYNLVLLTLIVLPVLYFTFKINGVWGTFTALTITLLLFGLPLSGLWRSGASEPFIIGGLLPFSDAASYYSDALRVVEGFRFSAFSARRPLFPALLTVLLAITGQNLVVSIAILGMFIAIICYLAAREIQRSLGTLPSIVFLFILFLFYRRIAGTTMTENLGLPLGVASFTILWGAARRKHLLQAAAGLLLLTLALNARAGTFFILPALLLWCGFTFGGKRKFSIYAFSIGLLVIALGFGLNMLVFKLVADPGGMVFSNFSYTLYGVVAGGKGWMQILIDHPELGQLEDVARSAKTYALVFDAFKAHPFNIVVGALKNWFDYLMPRGAGAFGFIRGNESMSWANYAIRIILSIFAGWGLITAWKQRKQEPFKLLLWAAVGIFLSVPFVPPNDSNQMRVYAATVPFLIAFSVIGLTSILELILKKKSIVPLLGESKPVGALFFGIILALISVGGVLLVKSIAKPQSLPLTVCPVGETSMIVRFSSGSALRIGVDQIAPGLDVPVDGFETINEGYSDMHEALVQTVGESTTLARPLDLISMQYPLLIIDPSVLQVSKGLFSICTIQSQNEELARRGWWDVKSTSRIDLK